MTLPVEVNPLLIGGGGYQISRSVRLRSSASAYFNRTPGSAGNRRLWTWSGWVKRSTLGAAQFLFNAGSGASTFEGIQLTAADTLIFYTNVSGTVYRIDSTALFRDPSAWYHIVCAIDTAQATASNRIKFYINGVQLTSFSPATYPVQNYDTLINSTISHGVGAGFAPSATNFLDGYLTEINFIDGQALTPASFGETDPVTGVWRAKKYTGTYGTNGFYLNFSDNSNNTATTIGKDYSGNGNNWTPNNISVTSGVTYDSMLDTPTPYNDGGNGRGNYATLNPLNNTLTLSNANLNFQNSTNAPRVSTATVEIPSGSKTYFEMNIDTLGGLGNYSQVGLVPPGKVLTSDIGAASGNGYSIEQNAAQDFYLRLNGSSVGPISVTPTSGDVLQVAVDMSTGKLWFGRNNTWYNSTGGTTGNPGAGTNETVTISTSASWFPAVNKYNTAGSYSVNFGQRPFAYTPPSGFKALNTQNLPAGTITTSGSFTGNASTNGPFIYLNGVPTAMTINGNAVTFGTHADKLANGFKVRSSSSSYNASGTNNYSITTTGAKFKFGLAQGNP